MLYIVRDSKLVNFDLPFIDDFSVVPYCWIHNQTLNSRYPCILQLIKQR